MAEYKISLMQGPFAGSLTVKAPSAAAALAKELRNLDGLGLEINEQQTIKIVRVA